MASYRQEKAWWRLGWPPKCHRCPSWKPSKAVRVGREVACPLRAAWWSWAHHTSRRLIRVTRSCAVTYIWPMYQCAVQWLHQWWYICSCHILYVAQSSIVLMSSAVYSPCWYIDAPRSNFIYGYYSMHPRMWYQPCTLCALEKCTHALLRSP